MGYFWGIYRRFKNSKGYLKSRCLGIWCLTAIWSFTGTFCRYITYNKDHGSNLIWFCLTGNLVDHTPFIQWVKHSSKKVIISNKAIAPVNVTKITTTVTTSTTASTTTTPELTGITLATDRFTNYSYIVNDTIYETKTLKLVRGEESYLNIVNATFEDSGIYTCTIFNRNGYANKSSTLTVVAGRYRFWNKLLRPTVNVD